MKHGLDPASAERLDDLVGTLAQLIVAIKANTAAIETANEYHDAALNGPH